MKCDITTVLIISHEALSHPIRMHATTISGYAIHKNSCPEVGVLILSIFLVVTNV